MPNLTTLYQEIGINLLEQVAEEPRGGTVYYCIRLLADLTKYSITS